MDETSGRATEEESLSQDRQMSWRQRTVCDHITGSSDLHSVTRWREVVSCNLSKFSLCLSILGWLQEPCREFELEKGELSSAQPQQDEKKNKKLLVHFKSSVSVTFPLHAWAFSLFLILSFYSLLSRLLNYSSCFHYLGLSSLIYLCEYLMKD